MSRAAQSVQTALLKLALRPTTLAGGIPLLGPLAASMAEGGPAPTFTGLGSGVGQALGGSLGAALARHMTDSDELAQLLGGGLGLVAGGGLGASAGRTIGEAFQNHLTSTPKTSALRPSTMAGMVPTAGPALANLVAGGPAPFLAGVGSGAGQLAGGLGGYELGQALVNNPAVYRGMKNLMGRRKARQVSGLMGTYLPAVAGGLGTVLGGSLGAAGGSAAGRAMSRHWGGLPQPQ